MRGLAPWAVHSGAGALLAAGVHAAAASRPAAALPALPGAAAPHLDDVDAARLDGRPQGRQAPVLVLRVVAAVVDDHIKPARILRVLHNLLQQRRVVLGPCRDRRQHSVHVRGRHRRTPSAPTASRRSRPCCCSAPSAARPSAAAALRTAAARRSSTLTDVQLAAALLLNRVPPLFRALSAGRRMGAASWRPAARAPQRAPARPPPLMLAAALLRPCRALTCQTPQTKCWSRAGRRATASCWRPGRSPCRSPAQSPAG